MHSGDWMGDSALKSLTVASKWIEWTFCHSMYPVLHNGSYTKPVIRPEVCHSGYQKPPLPYRHHGDE